MKPTKYQKRNKFKDFLEESWSVYLVVAIVLSAIGIFFSISTSGNVVFNVISIVLGVVFVISFMMLIEFLIWKKKN